jgi:4-amino-4-deoxy-L-arabinose transferase-like glycosyltransferase
MLFIRKLIIGLLSFYAFEVKRSDLRNFDTQGSDTQIERIYESRKRKLKKKEQTYDNRKWKKKKKYAQKTLKLQGVTPKDIRYSNQRKLRRMYRNS